MSDATLVHVHAKGDRSAFLEVPAGVLPLPDALLRAAEFLIEGLDGLPLDAVVRAIAQLVASATPASSADAVVRARIVTGGVAVTSADVPLGIAFTPIAKLPMSNGTATTTAPTAMTIMRTALKAPARRHWLTIIRQRNQTKAWKCCQFTRRPHPAS